MTVVPAATDRAHLPSRDKRCDTVTVLNMAARHRPGRRYADMNACATLDGDVNLHYPDNPVANHFEHIVDEHTGKIRPMRPAERQRPVDEWHTHDVLRWRRKVSRVSRWTRPYTVFERQMQAKARRVIICWEIKSRAYGNSLAACQRFARAVTASGWRAYVMTLVNMRGWGKKMKNFHLAGMGTALLTHGCARPRDYPDWDQYLDRLWPNHWGHGASQLGAS